MLVALASVLAFLAGIAVAALVGNRRRKARERRQYALRDALSQWAYYYRERKPADNTAESQLLKAVYQVGTMNLLNHDRW